MRKKTQEGSRERYIEELEAVVFSLAAMLCIPAAFLWPYAIMLWIIVFFGCLLRNNHLTSRW